MFLETPFTQLAAAPAEGVGLNPLLRHPSMMIHPPMLYSGYTLFAIPFAFAVGALISRRLNADWIRLTRPFTLAAWFFLGIGIILGARWSYSELGWGGYWAWDPVENASLMPWLTGTAFLHSVMIQERRGMLKVWNVSLILATGVLAILGTFLVRSGILQSIHAFGASTLGVPFLLLIVTMIAGSIALVGARASELRSEHRLDSLLSREAVFLLNNLVLVGLCFVVFWGTFFPLISEAVTGNQASVGPPWFNRYITPLALVLVLLSGIGPVIAWRRATPANLRKVFAIPGGAALGTLAILLVAGVTEQRHLADHVLAGGVRLRRRGPGVLARCPRAAGDERGAGAGRARLARAPQPPALRRLPRARGRRRPVRRRRRVLGVPGPARGAPGARPDREGGRLRDHLRQADGPRGGRAQRAPGADRPGRRPARAPRRAAGRRAAHAPLLLPDDGPDARAGLALLRGRGDQRGRPARRLAARPVDGRSRRTSRR